MISFSVGCVTRFMVWVQVLTYFLQELGTVVLSGIGVRSLVYVPGLTSAVVTHDHELDTRCDLVWVATDDQRILFYSASDPERGHEVGRLVLPHNILAMVYHMSQVMSFDWKFINHELRLVTCTGSQLKF